MTTMWQRRSVLVFFLVVFAMSPFQVAALADSKNPRSITVKGVAQKEVPPDRVVVTFRIVSLHPELADSVAESDASVKRLTAALGNKGVAPSDIHTGYLRVTQRYSAGYTQEFLGYVVTRYIVVTLREVENYSAVLETALSSGATHIDRADFQTTELRKHRDAARADAAMAAREKAVALAGQFGNTLGQVLTVEETANSRSAWERDYSANVHSISGAPSVSDGATSTGMITITSTVLVTFELE